MKKEMLINVKQPEECRIAIVEDGVLEELYVERTSHESFTGNIYKGRIVNLEPAIQAAFVDFSVGRNGFLHVSDVESQYFDRVTPAVGDPESPPRDRERRRDGRREGDRGRSREPRRRPPAPEAVDPPFAPPDIEPIRADDRFPDRPRDPQRDRERNRPRERERPDQSIKGRRDRSERGPRRFGEGLVSQPEPWPEPEPILPEEAVAFQDEAPFAQDASQPPRETGEDVPPPWPPSGQNRAEDRLAEERSDESSPGWPPERPLESEPPLEELSEPDLIARELLDPFETDLPPSRTQRKPPPARQDDPAGAEWDHFRTAVPHSEHPEEREWLERRTRDLEDDAAGGRRGRRGARPRGRSPVPPARSPSEDLPFASQPPLADDLPPGFEPDSQDRSHDRPRPSPVEASPREHGGRAAIRARGGNVDRPRDPQPLSEPRPARGHAAPGGGDSAGRRHGAPERSAEPERRRPAEPPRDRDRSLPHARAGEPGYVPRRERLKSSDAGFGSDIFPPESEWPERATDAGPSGDARSRAATSPRTTAASTQARPRPASPAKAGPIPAAAAAAVVVVMVLVIAIALDQTAGQRLPLRLKISRRARGFSFRRRVAMVLRPRARPRPGCLARSR